MFRSAISKLGAVMCLAGGALASWCMAEKLRRDEGRKAESTNDEVKNTDTERPVAATLPAIPLDFRR